MSRKQVLIFLFVALALAALVYLQVREWKKFDWATFADETSSLNWGLVLLAVLVIYFADSIRAWRWAILLRPTKKVAAIPLIAPQFIGFAGLSLFGRPGELIRPYLIARRVALPLSSQMAVWTVERIFDFASVTSFLLLDVLFSPSLRELPAYGAVRNAGFALTGVVIAGIILALLILRYGSPISNWIERRLSRRFPHIAARSRRRIQEFSDGLHTIHDLKSFVACSLISLTIWGGVLVAYRLVTFAYNDPEVSQLDFPQVVLLMFASIAGGVLQLPLIGGGSQLATISVMKSENFFNIRPELATSCGIMLWLVTFISVVPIGLAIARREHVSLLELEQESHHPTAAEPSKSA